MTSKRRIVLDASAVLAWILKEPGEDQLSRQLLEHVIVGAVNMAEVQARLVRGGYDPEAAWSDSCSLISRIEPYTAEQAKLAGTLIAKTHILGLSLGDRSCLALALTLNVPVYTTDRTWRNLNVGIPIHVIR